MDKIRVVSKRVGQDPVVLEVDNDLLAFQTLVGGLIEVIYLPNSKFDLIVNEEGRLAGLEPNFTTTLDGARFVIAGDVFFTKANDDGDFISLSDDEVQNLLSSWITVAACGGGRGAGASNRRARLMGGTNADDGRHNMPRIAAASERVAICTFNSRGYAPLAEYTLASKRLYCERHGYDLFWFEREDATTSWDRVRMVERQIKTGDWDIVMWMDCDALFTNHAIRVEDVICDASFAISTDLHGINNGTFICRDRWDTREFLYSVVNEGPKLVGDHPMMDQEAMARLLSRAPYCNLGVQYSQRAMNSYLQAEYGREGFSGEWEPGDWILHLPGMEMSRRIFLAAHYDQIAQR